MGSQPQLTPQQVMRGIRAQHPRLREALPADARVTAAYRGERSEFRSRADTVVQILRLCWKSDAFLAQALYRLKARLQRAGVPILPELAHRLAIIVGQVYIGDPVVVKPGLYILHGQVTIDGFTEIGSGVTIAPYTGIGLRAGNVNGPKVGDHVQVGIGSTILGPVRVGEGAHVGANAVVIDDVEPGATVVGAPARPVASR